MIAKSRKTRIGNKIRIQSDLTNFQIHFLDDFHDFYEFWLENDQIRIFTYKSLSDENIEIVALAAVMRTARTMTKEVNQHPPISFRSWLRVNIERNSGRIVAQTNDKMHSKWRTTLTTEQN